MAEVADQFSQVLHGGDEQILDRLLPESAPPSLFETVTVSGISEAAFAQVLASFKVPLGRLGVSDLARLIQQLLISMSVDGATLRERVQKSRNLHSKQVPLAVTYSQVRRCGCKRRGRISWLAGQR